MSNVSNNKTNLGLVAHAEKALKEKWFYGWGSYGQKATVSLVESLVRQYVSMNTRWKSYMTGAVNANSRLCDCYGLIKSYLWWSSDNANPKYSSTQDRNTSMAYNAAKEKGPLSTLPEIPGIILYMSGHVGVYCGDGRFIELMGGGVGAYEGRIQDGRIAKGSKFTHWFKDTFIEYSNTAEVAPPASTNEPSSWAETAWNWGIEKGITDGTNPKGNATREQVLQLLYKASTLV